MKTAMVIPTYWGRKSADGVQPGDRTYDHPTPLDEDGTLQRCLESIELLDDKDFTLVVLACATAEGISNRVDEKIRTIIERSNVSVDTVLFSGSGLRRMNELVRERTGVDYNDLLTLDGYSPVRNMCLFSGHLLGAEITVFIDDDEVFEDPSFISKCREHIGKTVDGETVLAVAGYYLQENNEYKLSPTPAPWMSAWDNVAKMNQGFEEIIGAGPRIKPTPFVFGGNMVIHRQLGMLVPFDPNVPRGEDIDYLMNLRMFGHTFFLDNELAIKHLPPPNSNPRWLQIRKDMRRFAFERAKIETQAERPGMCRITAEDFDPYPGAFLKSDLEQKARDANRILSDTFAAQGDEANAAESEKNVALAEAGLTPEGNPFQALCELKVRWETMMQATGEEGLQAKLEEIVRDA